MSVKLDYEDIANRTHNNAVDLLTDAQLLIKSNRFPRAFFLACLSLEELGKSQITLDYINGETPKETFDKAFSGGVAHILKLAYQYRWKVLSTKTGKTMASIKYDLDRGRALQTLKEQSLYAQKKNDIEHDWKTLAEEMIEYVDSWLYNILCAEWLNSPKRGSKALYK